MMLGEYVRLRMRKGGEVVRPTARWVVSAGASAPQSGAAPSLWRIVLRSGDPKAPRNQRCGGVAVRQGRLERSLPVLGRSTFPGSAITLRDRNSSARECVNSAVKAHD
jgi:hypothetical protein